MVRARHVIGSLGVLLAILIGLAAPATAQDPYGSTSTTAPGSSVATACSLTLSEGSVGDLVTATVADVPAGMTVRVLFGGNEVGRGAAPAGAASPVLIDFRVPAVGAGQHLVTAVGTGFTLQCGAEVGGQFLVRGGASAAAGSGGGGGDARSSLPYTGASILAAVIVGLALLIVGRTLLAAARQQRRAAREADRFPTAPSAARR